MRQPPNPQLQQLREASAAEQKLELLRRVKRTPRQLAGMLGRRVYGQDPAVRAISVVLHQHLLRVAAILADEEPPPTPTSRILLVGPSGVGKTHLCRSLAEIANLPVHIADGSAVTAQGWAGNSVDDAVIGLMRAAHNSRILSACGVLVIDELDKNVIHPALMGADIGGKGAQESLLTLLDGAELCVKSYAADRSLAYTTPFNARDVLLIAAGAFGGLDAIIAKRLRGKQQVGFGAGHQGSPLPAATGDLLAKLELEDLIEFGLIPELVGRFSLVQALQPLSLDTRLAILRDSETGPVKTLQGMAKRAGFKLRFTSPLLERIVAKTETSPLGARVMYGLAHKCAEKALYEVPDLRRARYCVAVATLGVEALENGDYSVRWCSREEAEEGAEPEEEPTGEGEPWEEPDDVLEA